MFSRWDTRALSYQDIEAGYTGEKSSPSRGYAYRLPDGDKVLVKELVLPKDMDFMKWPKPSTGAMGPRSTSTGYGGHPRRGAGPYAMAHWIKENDRRSWKT